MNVALNFALVPPFGIEGAAAGSAGSAILATGLAAVFLWRRSGLAALPMVPTSLRRSAG